MDFKAFCRSVLLAQNRFSEFLKATPTDRDKVLKGVFGYERARRGASVAAERRLDREADGLEVFAREREPHRRGARTARGGARDAASAERPAPRSGGRSKRPRSSGSRPRNGDAAAG